MSVKKISSPPSSDHFVVPYESLLGVRVKRPILSHELQEQVDCSIANITGAIRWEKWGMAEIKDGGSVILMIGPSGTGKTTIARWIAKKIGTGFIPLTMGAIGGAAPGDTDRNLNKIFNQAECTIFIDECDGILSSRDKLGPDSMWMVSVINALLMRIEKCKHTIIMATNRDHELDPALERRISDRIYVSTPDQKTRQRLWEEKIPQQYPLQLIDAQIIILACFELTGAEIENVIIAETKLAIRSGRNPKFDSLCSVATNYVKCRKTLTASPSSTKRAK